MTQRTAHDWKKKQLERSGMHFLEKMRSVTALQHGCLQTGEDGGGGGCARGHKEQKLREKKSVQHRNG